MRFVLCDQGGGFSEEIVVGGGYCRIRYDQGNGGVVCGGESCWKVFDDFPGRICGYVEERLGCLALAWWEEWEDMHRSQSRVL